VTASNSGSPAHFMSIAKTSRIRDAAKSCFESLVISKTWA